MVASISGGHSPGMPRYWNEWVKFRWRRRNYLPTPQNSACPPSAFASDFFTTDIMAHRRDGYSRQLRPGTICSNLTGEKPVIFNILENCLLIMQSVRGKGSAGFGFSGPRFSTKLSPASVD